MIPYFDAHCDTIHRCVISSRPDQPEAVQAYWDAVQGLRRNGGHVDLVRSKTFDRYAQFFALYHNPEFAPEEGMWAMCLRLHDCFLHEMEENADLVRHCRTADEVRAAAVEGKIAALLSVEAADLLECDPERVSAVAGWGVRLCNLTWNVPNAISGTNCADSDRGLSPRGRDFVRALEESAVYADVSHLSDPGFWDLIRMARRPVVASHSNSRALCPHPRNLTDDMFRAIRDSGGVVGINLYRDFVGKSGSMDELVAHVEHFLELDGEKTVCLGGDLDGCEALAGGMKGVEDVPRLYEALRERGYSETLLEDIFWNNPLRLL